MANHLCFLIEIKHGDWLSKYSAAMYNDFGVSMSS